MSLVNEETPPHPVPWRTATLEDAEAITHFLDYHGTILPNDIRLKLQEIALNIYFPLVNTPTETASQGAQNTTHDVNVLNFDSNSGQQRRVEAEKATPGQVTGDASIHSVSIESPPQRTTDKPPPTTPQQSSTSNTMDMSAEAARTMIPESPLTQSQVMLDIDNIAGLLIQRLDFLISAGIMKRSIRRTAEMEMLETLGDGCLEALVSYAIFKIDSSHKQSAPKLYVSEKSKVLTNSTLFKTFWLLHLDRIVDDPTVHNQNTSIKYYADYVEAIVGELDSLLSWRHRPYLSRKQRRLVRLCIEDIISIGLLVFQVLNGETTEQSTQHNTSETESIIDLSKETSSSSSTDKPPQTGTTVKSERESSKYQHHDFGGSRAHIVRKTISLQEPADKLLRHMKVKSHRLQEIQSLLRGSAFLLWDDSQEEYLFEYLNQDGTVSVDSVPVSAATVAAALEEAFEWQLTQSLTVEIVDSSSSESDSDDLIFVGQIRRGFDGLFDDFSLYEEEKDDEVAPTSSNVAPEQRSRPKRPLEGAGGFGFITSPNGSAPKRSKPSLPK